MRIKSMRTLLSVATLTIGLTVSDVHAQPILDCGAIGWDHSLSPIGYVPYVRMIVRTYRQITSCPLEVQAEGWVEGVGRASTNRGVHSAEVHVLQPTWGYGTWRSVGKHWLIWWYGAQWEYMATTTDETYIEPDPNSFTQEELCVANGGEWNYEWQYCDTPPSPIIIDTEHNGYKLTSAENGVLFDIDADGDEDQVAWTRPDSDDVWLAMDRNGNGKIDNGSELFGDATPAYADQPDPTTSNGFEALKFAEGPTYGPSTADAVINQADAVFSRLLLWRDANHNGISEADELQPVSGSAVVAIDTKYKESRRRDRHGNEFRQKGKAWWATPEGQQVAYPIFDVWLQTSQTAGGTP